MSRIDELEKVIKDARTEIEDIRNECSHPVSCVTKEYWGSSGNYDPDDNCYKIHLECSLCGKRWTFTANDTDDNYRLASIKYTKEKKK
jgi:ribosomal protein L33